MVYVGSQNGGSAVKITLLAADGTTIIANSEAGGAGMSAALTFNTSVEDKYYIRIDPLEANLFGTEAQYSILISDVKTVFLPLAVR